MALASSATLTLTNRPPISAAAATPISSFRSKIVTFAPCAARSLAVAFPSPEAPPVTIAPTPFKSICFVLLRVATRRSIDRSWTIAWLERGKAKVHDEAVKPG